MKKILILGGSHRDIPLIAASKKLGYYVVTLGDRDYYLGHSYADKSYKVNFNDLKKVKQIIKNENIDYLIPGSGEESYLNTVRVSEELNIGSFDDIETAELIHNKWKFKEFCIKHGITTPYGFYYQNDTDLKNLTYPLVVKPTNLSGGRGVEVSHDEKELENALKQSFQVSNEIFIEEYIDGELYAYSIFIKNKKIHYGFLGKDDVYLNKYLISTAYPASLKERTLAKLKLDIEKISQTLSLVDGMFHLQVIVKDDRAYIIDVTRRIPGDLYPDLIEYCDGVQYSKAVVKAYTGQSIVDEFKTDKRESFVIRHCVMADKNGILRDIFIDSKIKQQVIARLDLVQNGAEIKNFLNTQISIIFIKLQQRENNIVKNINKLIYPIIDVQE